MRLHRFGFDRSGALQPRGHRGHRLGLELAHVADQAAEDVSLPLEKLVVPERPPGPDPGPRFQIVDLRDDVVAFILEPLPTPPPALLDGTLEFVPPLVQLGDYLLDCTRRSRITTTPLSL